MKRVLSVVMIASIVLSMFVILTPKAIASENVIFQDDFESYSPSTFPSSGGWQVVWNGAGDQYQVITDSYCNSPTKSLQLMGSYGWSVVVKKDFSSSSNIIGYEACLMAPPGGGGLVAFCNIPIATWGRYYAMVGFSGDGYIWASERGIYTHQLQPFSPYTWYKIRVVMDRTAKVYNVWIDDVLKGQDIPEYYDPYEILSLQFQVGWANVYGYFDDAKVFEVSGTPPPTGPVITSVSTITATRLQTIHIYGSGFGNTQPQTVPAYNNDGSVDTVVSSTTPCMGISDLGLPPDAWAAGVQNASNGVHCAIGIYLTSWSDTEIVLGGFGSALNTNGQGPWNIAPGDTLDVAVFTASGEAHYRTTVAGAPTMYTVTITSGTGGSVSYSSSYGSGTISSGARALQVPSGAQVSLTANPDSMHAFQTWSTTGPVSVSSPSSASTTATVNGNGGVTANFAAYSLSVYPDYVNTYQDWPITFEGRVVDQLGNGVPNEIVGIVDPLNEQQSLSRVTDDYGYFLYSVKATKTESGPEPLEFSFIINSQTQKRNVIVNDASSDTNRLLNMWNYFKNSADFLPKDANGKIIGYAKYAGIFDTLYPGKVLTEGQGYSLLRAVWMDDKPTYDAIRGWTDAKMWVPESKSITGKAYLGWCWDPDEGKLYDPYSTPPGADNPPSAPDGDEDIALAAVLAYFRWNDIRDKEFAQKVLRSFRENDVMSVGGRNYVSFGNSQYTKNIVDPSYMSPYAYRIFANFDSDNRDFWNGLVDSSYEVLSKIQDQCAGGLVSDYGTIFVDSRGTTTIKPVKNNQVNGDIDYSCYGYDAFRTMWRVSLDVYFNSDPRGYAFLKKPADFFIGELKKPQNGIYDRYNALDATPGSDALPISPLTQTTLGGDIGATLLYTSPEAQEATDKIAGTLRFFADFPGALYASFYEDSWVWFGIAVYQGIIHLASSRMDITIQSPADLLVTDPHGRRVGFDQSTGEVVSEIPGASYSGGGTEPQTVTMLDPIHGNYNITLLGTATGSYTLTLKYNTSSPTAETRTLTGTIMKGSIQTYSMDIEGSTFTASLSDNTPPATTLGIGKPSYTDTAGNVYVSLMTPFTLTAKDNLGGSSVASIAYRIHNGTYDSGWLTYSVPFYLTGLTDRQYCIDYNSTDIAGNVELTNTAIIVLDNTSPTTTISIGQPKYVADKTYMTRDTPFALEAHDGEGSGIYSIAYRISNITYDSGWLPYTAPFRLTALSDGVYNISFNATDNVGNTEAAKSIQVTLFSWNCVFTDSYGRGTILKINTWYKFFQFIAPGKDFGVKRDPKMFALCSVILISYKDSAMQLAATGAYGRLTFCTATAWDKQTGKRYLLIQKPIFRCHLNENLIP